MEASSKEQAALPVLTAALSHDRATHTFCSAFTHLLHWEPKDR